MISFEHVPPSQNHWVKVTPSLHLTLIGRSLGLSTSDDDDDDDDDDDNNNSNISNTKTNVIVSPFPIRRCW